MSKPRKHWFNYELTTTNGIDISDKYKTYSMRRVIEVMKLRYPNHSNFKCNPEVDQTYRIMSFGGI